MAKLLVIDDEQPILEMLEMSLGSEGYEVMTAESGDEGQLERKLQFFELLGNHLQKIRNKRREFIICGN